MNEAVDRPVISAADVSVDLIDEALDLADGFYPDRIDWEGLLARLESDNHRGAFRWSFGDSWDTPAIRKLRRAVAAARREASA